MLENVNVAKKNITKLT